MMNETKYRRLMDAGQSVVGSDSQASTEESLLFGRCADENRELLKPATP